MSAAREAALRAGHFGRNSWLVPFSGRSTATGAPRPPKQCHAGYHQDAAETCIPATTAHSRTVDDVRTLQDEHDSNETESDTDHSTDPHVCPPSWTRHAPSAEPTISADHCDLADELSPEAGAALLAGYNGDRD